MKKKKEKKPKTKAQIEKDVNELKDKILEKYGDIVKCVIMMGSVARGEFKSKSDVDVFIVVDDTTKSITAGFFMPVKKLLKMGKIPATREAIESYMEGAPKKLMRAKTVKLLMLAEDCYYSMLNTAQAVLMFMGLEPPVPSKAYVEVKKYLVDPGILEQKYADWLKEIIAIRKKIEHKELMDVTGAYVDEWIDKADKFIEKMFQLLSVLEFRKKEKILERTHEVMYKAAIAALKTLKKMREYVRNLIRDLAKVLKKKEKKKG